MELAFYLRKVTKTQRIIEHDDDSIQNDPHAKEWDIIRRAIRAKEGMIRTRHMKAHLGEEGVRQGLLTEDE